MRSRPGSRRPNGRRSACKTGCCCCRVRPGLALVGFAEAIGPVRNFAAAHKDKVDANQELIGLGVVTPAPGCSRASPFRPVPGQVGG